MLKYSNVTDALAERALSIPDNDAIILPDKHITYAQLDEMVWRAAAYFDEKGVRNHHTVVFMLSDDYFLAIATLGLIRLGATVARTSAASTHSQLIAHFKEIKLNFIISNVKTEFNYTTINFDDTSIDKINYKKPTIAQGNGPVFLLFGSGTTGDVKIIPIYSKTIFGRCLIGEKENLYQFGSRVLMLYSLQFAVPMIRLFVLINNGATLILTNQKKINLPNYVRLTKANVIQGAAMHFELILKNLDFNVTHNFESLRAARVGSSTVSRDLRDRILRHIAPAVSVSYSANECGVISEIFDDGNIKFQDGSVGTVLDGVDVKIVSNRDLELPAGEIGKILVKTPCLISGYYNNEQENKKRFRNGWFDTGDLGSLSSEGELIYHGRSDNMLIFNGVNIYPAEIELCLRDLSDIMDMHIFSLNHKIHQDVPACAIQLKPNSKLSADEVKLFLKSKLGMKCPQLVLIIDSIPRAANGKLLKSELLELITQKMNSDKKS